MAKSKSDLLDEVHGLGFDASFVTSRGVRVRCSECEACTINGVPCHEGGCPNQTHECRGCNARVKRAGSYCEDCR